MSQKKAVITGVTGQDGSYLAELLLSKEYIVYGIVRQSTQFTRDRWGYLKKALLACPDQFVIKYADLNDYGSLRDLLDTVKPDEIYNLAAQSHVGQSFEQPMNTCEVTAIGALRLLEAAKKSCPRARFYQASSSEMFGKVQSTPQNESTGFHPRSPYGVAKVFAHWATVNYREAYGMYATSGILFNHESERRGEQFVTRKITRAVGRIVTGKQRTLKLGNIAAKRDWGYAPDYVKAMWLMLQQDTPSDYVIGTGKHHSVEDFLSAAFTSVNLDWKDYVEFDVDLNRPSEVDTLLADSRRAKFELGWEPKTNFRELVALMVQHDVALAKVED